MKNLSEEYKDQIRNWINGPKEKKSKVCPFGMCPDPQQFKANHSTESHQWVECREICFVAFPSCAVEKMCPCDIYRQNYVECIAEQLIEE